MMKKYFLILTLALLAFGHATMLRADTGNPGGGGGGNPSFSFRLENPFKIGSNLFDLINALLKNVVIPLGGILAVLGFIWSGFLYVTAQGNPNKLKDANKALLYTSIGTAILLGAEAISLLVQNTFTSLLR